MTETLGGVSVGLEAPIEIVWESDLGPNQTLEEINDYLRDVQAVIELGESWALLGATKAAQYAVGSRFRASGDAAVGSVEWTEKLLHQMMRMARGHGSRRILPTPPESDAEDNPSRTPEETDWRNITLGDSYISLSDAFTIGTYINFVGDISATDVRLANALTWRLLGARTVIQSITYQNPIVIVIPIVAGTIGALRWLLPIIRDWGNQRRQGAAEAGMAEQQLRLMTALTDQVEAGILPVPAAELLRLASPSQVRALDAVATKTTSIEEHQT